MEQLAQLATLSAIVEALTERLKAGVPAKYQKAFVFWAALVFGVGLGMLSGADLLATLGLPLSVRGANWLGPVISSALTGILASRGANVAHDLLAKLKPKDANAAYDLQAKEKAFKG